MKKKYFVQIMYTAILMGLAVLTQPTTAQEQKNDQTAQTIKKALDEHTYKIDIDYMTPMKGRSRALTTLYSLEVKNDSIFSYLPYVGEAYNVPYGGGKGLNFQAPISQYESKEGKKGATEIKLKTRNEEILIPSG